MPHTSDTRVTGYEPLLSPAGLLDELPLGSAAEGLVEQSRDEVRAVLDGADDRLLVIAGPCSVHDPAAALDYARRLAALRDALAGDLLIVMRVYFEKPRPPCGWKGLINDPGMDGSHDVQRGLRLARRLLLDVTGLGLPVGCEFLDPITPQYIADTVAWGAIGARTTESQVHRQLASGLSMPIGFKNGTDGDVRRRGGRLPGRRHRHTFLGVTGTARPAVVTTAGNPDCHVILRGGRPGPNYDAAHVAAALEQLAGAGLARRVMVDASHGNSGKDHRRQPEVAQTGRSVAGASAASSASCWRVSWWRAQDRRPGRADLRPERHRRLHGLRRHRGRAAQGWPTRSASAAASPAPPPSSARPPHPPRDHGWPAQPWQS